MSSFLPIVQLCHIAKPPRRSFRKQRENHSTNPTVHRSADHAALGVTTTNDVVDLDTYTNMFNRLTDLGSLDPQSPAAHIALRCRRIQLCLSSEDLGRMIGKDASYIDAIEMGDPVAVHSVWERISQSINKSVLVTDRKA